MDKKIELKVLEITGTLAPANAYALLLGERKGDRQLPVIIGASEAQSIMLCMKGIKPPRPLTHDLLHNCLNILETRLLRVLIYKVKDGVFYAQIYLKKDNEMICIDSRTSDAVALALRMSAPIYIYESILDEEKLKCLPQEETSCEPVSTNPENIWQSWNNVQLQQHLNLAVQEENYELAAQLRDEINRRK